MRVRVWLLGFCFGFAAAVSCSAGDWPQIHGPHRNGVADDEHLAEKWPEAGPKVLWRAKTGSGYSGVAVAEGKAILFHRVGDEDLLQALDARTGKLIWITRLPEHYQPSITDNNGPLCVPTIADNVIVCFGADGRMSAVEFQTGNKLWSRPLCEEYQAPLGYFGAGSSPLIHDQKVFVNVGGDRKGAGIVALELKTGKTVWAKLAEQASYSSPVLMPISGEPALIFITRLNAVALSPHDGKLLWKYPFGKRGPTVNAALPVIQGDGLFLTASYGIGAVFLKCQRDDVTAAWKTDEFLSSQYTTSVPSGGAYYGIEGRQDAGSASLCCFDPASQTMHWKEEGFIVGHLIAADGKLIVLRDDGQLLLVRPNM
ncbi:MAG: PQQ-binding-like beta-propeller repeat protein [Planctomycetales bacterium]